MASFVLHSADKSLRSFVGETKKTYFLVLRGFTYASLESHFADSFFRFVKAEPGALFLLTLFLKKNKFDWVEFLFLKKRKFLRLTVALKDYTTLPKRNYDDVIIESLQPQTAR